MKKNLLFIVSVIMALCVFCSCVTVLAEPTEDSGSGETPVETQPVNTEPETTQPVSETEEPTEPETTEEDNFIPSDYDTTEAEQTEADRPTQSTTRKPVPSTTRKPKPTTTRKPADDDEDDRNNNNNDNQNDNRPVNQNPVDITEDEDDLPEGSFYVYLERNNGTRRLKAILTKPELVSEPEIPVREGFIFDGWYADPEFKEKWNFFTDMAQEGTVIYAKWVPDPNAVVYKISINAVEGGTIEVNPTEASVGEPVLITVNPDEGMRLVAGSVTINGKSTDILNFNMPAENVVISARFEAIPEREQEPEEKKSALPFVLGGIVVLIAIGVVVFFIIRRRDDFAEDEIDENGTIIDNDVDMSWVDESIVVEDGFKDGEKVVGNFIPEVDDTFEIEDDE